MPFSFSIKSPVYFRSETRRVKQSCIRLKAVERCSLLRPRRRRTNSCQRRVPTLWTSPSFRLPPGTIGDEQYRARRAEPRSAQTLLFARGAAPCLRRAALVSPQVADSVKDWLSGDGSRFTVVLLSVSLPPQPSRDHPSRVACKPLTARATLARSTSASMCPPTDRHHAAIGADCPWGRVLRRRPPGQLIARAVRRKRHCRAAGLPDRAARRPGFDYEAWGSDRSGTAVAWVNIGFRRKKNDGR
jgi:hypothetical protein